MTLELTREQRAMAHIGYEVYMCATSAHRMATSSDQDATNAYLECMLLHSRALAEFLVLSKSGHPDDMLRTEFAPDWTPSPKDAVARLSERRSVTNKFLAHLTWPRVDDPNPPEWSFVEIAVDSVAVARAWLEHVAQSEGMSVSDHEMKALILRHDVERAETILGEIDLGTRAQTSF